MARLIASPSPVPGIALSSAAAVRKKRPKTWGRSLSAMPIPVSHTSTTTSPSTFAVRMTTLPPSGVNFSAFDVRFVSTWVRRERSASTGSVACRSGSIWIFFSAADGMKVSRTSFASR